MGSLLSKKRPPGEELETLSAQMRVFRQEIESMTNSRRTSLWYLTLILFFVTTSAMAYFVMKNGTRERQILHSCGTFILGGILLLLARKVINFFFDFRVRRKQQYLDELIAKKKSILENVKETETFKVAKEILEKYEDESPRVSQSNPSSPQKNRRPSPGEASPMPTPIPAQMTPAKPPFIPYTPVGHPRHALGGPRPIVTPTIVPTPGARQGPMQTPLERPRTLAPIRPFAPEPKTGMDKMMDYFFGDGPKDRFALICQQCHGHNGMALAGEYEYLAYVCYICGHFNPAKKMRPQLPSSMRPTPGIPRTASNLSLPVASLSEFTPNGSSKGDDEDKESKLTEDEFEELSAGPSPSMGEEEEGEKTVE